MPKSEPLTFKRLCDAAVTAGEMSKGTADYFYGLYLNSDECRDLAAMKELFDANPHALFTRTINGERENAMLRRLLASAKPKLEEHQDTATGQSEYLRNLIAAISAA